MNGYIVISFHQLKLDARIVVVSTGIAGAKVELLQVGFPISDIPFELVRVLHHPLQLEPSLLSLRDEGVGLVVHDPSRIFVVAKELVFEKVARSIASASPHGTWQCCVFWHKRACGHLN